MRSLHQLYRLRPNTRSLHVPGPQMVPPRWYRLGFLVREVAKKHGLKNPFDLPPFDQSAATC
jgi:hypothetical protein